MTAVFDERPSLAQAPDPAITAASKKSGQ